MIWISRRGLGMIVSAVAGALAMSLAIGAIGAIGKPDPNPSNHHGKRTGALGAHGKRHRSHPYHHGKRTGAPLIDESLAPSQPTDPAVHSVNPGGLPWVLARGHVRLKRDGKLDLQVKGLVIPTAPYTGTPGPVTTISASLYCGADLNTAPVDTTQQVPLSHKGDARIHDTSFTVPATCLAPVILVHPNGLATSYIALDGWRLS